MQNFKLISKVCQDAKCSLIIDGNLNKKYIVIKFRITLAKLWINIQITQIKS